MKSTRSKFYAVKVGKKPGIYADWTSCSEQVNGFKGSIHKSFSTIESALEFMGISNAEHAKISNVELATKVFIDDPAKKLFGRLEPNIPLGRTKIPVTDNDPPPNNNVNPSNNVNNPSNTNNTSQVNSSVENRTRSSLYSRKKQTTQTVTPNPTATTTNSAVTATNGLVSQPVIQETHVSDRNLPVNIHSTPSNTYHYTHDVSGVSNSTNSTYFTNPNSNTNPNPSASYTHTSTNTYPSTYPTNTNPSASTHTFTNISNPHSYHTNTNPSTNTYPPSYHTNTNPSTSYIHTNTYPTQPTNINPSTSYTSTDSFTPTNTTIPCDSTNSLYVPTNSNHSYIANTYMNSSPPTSTNTSYVHSNPVTPYASTNSISTNSYIPNTTSTGYTNNENNENNNSYLNNLSTLEQESQSALHSPPSSGPSTPIIPTSTPPPSHNSSLNLSKSITPLPFIFSNHAPLLPDGSIGRSLSSNTPPGNLLQGHFFLNTVPVNEGLFYFPNEISSQEITKLETEAALHVYIDGSSRRNPGPAGSGMYIISCGDGKGITPGGSDGYRYSASCGVGKKETNIFAELMGFNLLPDVLKEVASQNRTQSTNPNYNFKNIYGTSHRLVIFSDSEWSIKTLSGSYKPNQKYKTLVSETQGKLKKLVSDFNLNVEIRFIRGHQGTTGNEMADYYAKVGATLNDPHDKKNNTIGKPRIQRL